MSDGRSPSIVLASTSNGGVANFDVHSFGVNLTGTSIFAKGDLNCDGGVNVFDIDPFVVALTAPSQYATLYLNCNWMLADCNGDGYVDAFDIDPFALVLDRPLRVNQTSAKFSRVRCGERSNRTAASSVPPDLLIRRIGAGA